MAILRFPSNVESGDRPHITFSTHKATYEKNASAYAITPTNDYVALYLPPNYSVNDLLRYEQASTGAIGNVFERTNGFTTGLTEQDVREVAEAVAVENAEKIAAGIGGLVGAATGKAGATVVGAATAPGVVGAVKAEKLKSYQRTLNPREFMLFKAPGIRQFGFNFTFIPADEKEVNVVPEIIKFFRRASYPETVAGGIQYQFPYAFNIMFGNSDKIIKIPEVICIGTNITYNPNSMSYYKVNNYPVEVSLQLSFQELQPIDRKLVEGGY